MIIQTQSGVVSYDQTGEGPDIVLLHSLLSDRHVFDRIVPRLAENRRVTTVDLPGFGNTDMVEVGIDNYADMVGGLIEALEMDPHSTSVLGNGLGGFVALGTGVRHGEKLDRLVLAGAGASFPPKGVGAFENMIQKVEMGGMEAILDIAIRRIYTEEYLANHPDEDQERRDVLRRTNPDAFIVACRSLITLDYRPSCADVVTQTLIVVGDEDAATPVALCDDLHQRLPNSSLVVFDGLAHAPQLQAPDRFLDVVLPFLDTPPKIVT